MMMHREWDATRPPRKGRGATYDPHNRFAPSVSEAIDDGWWQKQAPVSLATEVRLEPARSALAWNTSPDLPFDRSINPYRGCEHGCIYCYARPSHAYWAARDAGARTAGWMLLRLPREVAPLFEAWLYTHYPERAGKVMSLIRQCRGGADYDSRFGHRMRGQGVFADLLEQRFQKACRRLGLNDPLARDAQRLDTSAFLPPRDQGDLFD